MSKEQHITQPPRLIRPIRGFAGAQLATVAFNWSQRPGYTLTQADCDMLKKLQSAWDVEGQSFVAPNAAEVASADALRLDWLEKHGSVAIERVRSMRAKHQLSVYEVTPWNEDSYEGATLREAIDAARQGVESAS